MKKHSILKALNKSDATYVSNPPTSIRAMPVTF